MPKIAIHALAWMLALAGSAHSARAQGGDARTFFAVSVADLDASVAWYAKMFDLTSTRRPGSDTVKVALLQGPGLVVELIQHAQAFDTESRVPELKDRYLGHGLFKAGFYVADLDATIARLRERGAAFRGTLVTDEVLGARSILVVDNGGNVIQLFQELDRR